MKKLIAGICVSALLATGVAFAGEPIDMRKEKMKSVGGAMGVLVKMSKGEMDFSTDAAVKALTTMNVVSKNMLDLFPKGSETGGKTTAKDTIWSDAAGFEKAMLKFETDSESALKSPPQNKVELAAVLGSMGGTVSPVIKATASRKSSLI